MSQICSKMVNSLFSAYFGGHLCYHSKGKGQINPILTLNAHSSLFSQSGDRKWLKLTGQCLKVLFFLSSNGNFVQLVQFLKLFGI